MSQINPYRAIVVPTPRQPPARPKKEGQGKRREQPPQDKTPSQDKPDVNGEHVDVTA